MRFLLRPGQDVGISDGRTRARSGEARLALELDPFPPPGRWIRLRYRAGFFDDPVRPVLHFKTASGSERSEPLNGAVWGIGEWTGRVPDGTVSLAVSPTDREGPFAFEILSVETVTMASLVRAGLGRDRRDALLALGIWLFADRPAAERLLKLVATTTPLDEYEAWHSRRHRPVDLAGFDVPRSDWTRAPRVRLVASLADATPDRLARTLASLEAQAYPRWTLSLADEGSAQPDVLAAVSGALDQEGRLRLAGADAPAVADEAGDPEDWWGAVPLGDELPPHALAVVTEHAARNPGLEILYGDEDAVTPEGRLHHPRFRPDWSGVSGLGLAGLGGFVLIRGARLEAAGVAPAALASEPRSALDRVVAAGVTGVGHIRRVIRRRTTERPFPDRPRTPGPAAPAGVAPPAAIVIPIRDRPELLEGCAAGLLARTDYPSVEVLIVDNGSVKPETFALLDRLRSDARVKVIDRPGPFNYSGLCNEGAAATAAPLLLFLNSDIDVIGPGWLRALASWAVRPDVGAVGAKLLFPDDTIQHAGVVVGVNGFAGHLYAGAARDEPGHLGELTRPHELSAVTGACLAVERAKFDAVGGFDAENLPVDLNDVDLCLRLRQRGWATVWTPEAELYHLESASRGRPIKGSKVYSRERAYFTRRWAHVIRDDPFYHPALSLFARRPSLA